MRKLAAEIEPYLNSGLLAAIPAALPILLLAARLPWLSSEAAYTVVGFGVLLFALLLAVFTSRRCQASGSAKIHLRLVLVVWWSLLISEEVFFRSGAGQEAFAGDFSSAGYGEAAFWGFAFLTVLLIMPRFQYLRGAFSGSNRWLSLYAVVCLVSAPFSPAPLYALAWAFKLFLAVLLLLRCSALMRDLDDVEAFFWSNFWGFALSAAIRIGHAFIGSSTAFEGGRLSESVGPTMLSLLAGTLLLLALSLNSLRKRAWLVGFGVFGATVMIMAGGKTGIIGGIVSVALFYVLQGRFAAGFSWLVGTFVLGCIVFAVTPLPTYFNSYSQAGGLSSLTGRTDLWRAVWPDILGHPVAGHGYMASRFLGSHVSGEEWATHTHNGFIEVIYNNGLVGLIILLAIMRATAKNLRQALWIPRGARIRLLAVGSGPTWINLLRHPHNRKVRLLAISSGAIWINLLINGLTNATFGGLPSSPCMLLLGLLVVSEALRRNSRPLLGYPQRSVAPACSPSAVGARTDEFACA